MSARAEVEEEGEEVERVEEGYRPLEDGWKKWLVRLLAEGRIEEGGV